MVEYSRPIKTSARKIETNKRQEENDWIETKKFLSGKGGKWKADNGTTFLLHEGVVYQYTSEFGLSSILIIDRDGRIKGIPLVAELTLDMQHVRPGNRGNFLKELLQEEDRNRNRRERGPKKRIHEKPRAEVIVIKEEDWLSKISKKRWGTIHWEQHMKPTEATRNSAKRLSTGFQEDLIYPGDTFEVIG